MGRDRPRPARTGSGGRPSSRPVPSREAGRFVQSATALFGADTVITLAALPLLHTIGPEPEAISPLAGIAYLLLLGWNVAVVAHVLRHALSTSRGPALMWAGAYILGTFIVASLGAAA